MRRYRKFSIADDVDVVVRCEVDGVMTYKGEDQLLSIKALNEFDSKTTGTPLGTGSEVLVRQQQESKQRHGLYHAVPTNAVASVLLAPNVTSFVALLGAATCFFAATELAELRLLPATGTPDLGCMQHS